MGATQTSSPLRGEGDAHASGEGESERKPPDGRRVRVRANENPRTELSLCVGVDVGIPPRFLSVILNLFQDLFIWSCRTYFKHLMHFTPLRCPELILKIVVQPLHNFFIIQLPHQTVMPNSFRHLLCISFFYSSVAGKGSFFCVAKKRSFKRIAFLPCIFCKISKDYGL